MAKKQKNLVIVFFILGNLIALASFFYLYLSNVIIWEVLLVCLMVQLITVFLLVFLYMLHIRLRALADGLSFHYVTRFLEQPRMEGTYKDNWWQLHYTSRAYGEYWGKPRTYVKLQYKEKKDFSEAVLKKYAGTKHEGIIIDSVEHVVRPYKNYLLMRVEWYVFDGTKVRSLMDHLLEISKKALK